MSLLKLLYGLGGLGLTAGAGYLGSELSNRASRSPSSTPPRMPLPPGSVDPNTRPPIPINPPSYIPSTNGGENPYQPQPTPTPAGNQDFGQLQALLDRLAKIPQQEAKEAREFYPQRTAIDFADFQRREEIARANTLERMREKTFRDTELGTISAWQGITQKIIERDQNLALGMLNLSATLGMPNPNVLTALSPVTQQAIAAFKPGTPV